MKHIALLAVLIGFFVPCGATADEPDKAVSKLLEMKSFFPEGKAIDPGLEGEDYQEYGRDTLFDYINGGAEVYLDLDFIKVGAREYGIELEEETYFTLDIYDMREPVNAFGIFTAERYEDAPKIEIGVDGYLDVGVLNFWCDRYYVKIRADWEGEAVDRILKKLASHVCERIGDPGRLPGELSLLPIEHRVPRSERYAARNLLGQSDLRGFSCRYKNDEEELRLFLCPYDKPEKAKAALKAFAKRLRPGPRAVEEGRGYLFEDKYRGNGRFVRFGNYLVIAMGLSGDGEKDAWRMELIDRFYDQADEASQAVKKEKE